MGQTGGNRAQGSFFADAADSNVGEGEGGGLADMRSARKADGNSVTVFRKVRRYQQSTNEIVQYQRTVPPGTATLAIDRD